MSVSRAVLERLPGPIEAGLRTARAWQRTHGVRMGRLRRTSPIDQHWGAGRGTPVDRVYIEQFLERHREDIRGRALEVKSPRYLDRYRRQVDRVEILDVDPSNPHATVVADLQEGSQLESDAYDCVILTQVLHFVFDVPTALGTLHRVLAPGGVLLATVPGITRLSAHESERRTDWWRFTAASARRLAEDAFGAECVDVETFGNVLSASALLYGLAAEELKASELATHDAAYEVTIGVRAAKRR